MAEYNQQHNQQVVDLDQQTKAVLIQAALEAHLQRLQTSDPKQRQAAISELEASLAEHLK